MEAPQKPKQKADTGNIAKYSGMGLQILATIFVLAWAGIWADRQLQWKFPLFTVVFSLAGVIGAIYSIIRRL